MKGKITKRAVDALKFKGKDDILWDDDLPRFGVKVYPTGRKVYVVQYRSGGRSRQIKIDDHGLITPDQARQKATVLLGQVSDGKDPAETKAVAKTIPTVAETVEKFFAEHVASKNKPRTYEEYMKLATNIIVPQLGKYRIDAIQRSHVAKLHNNLKETPYQGNRALALLSKFFNWCEMIGLRPDRSNPCLHVPRYHEMSRESLLSDADVARLWQALMDADRDGTASLHAVAALKLLFLTGCRLNEILTLTWDEVDFEGKALRLTDAKTIKVKSATGTKKVVPLHAQALELLASLPRVEGNSHVIVGKVDGHCMVNLGKPWRRIRSAAGLPALRIHDLRHNFASTAAMAGLSLPLIARMMGHTQTATTNKYAHFSDDPVRQGMDRMGDRLMAATTNTPDTDNVFEIRKSHG